MKANRYTPVLRRGSICILFAASVIAISAALLANPMGDPVHAYCEDDPGARDTTQAPISYTTHLETPFQFDLDSGWLPGGVKAKLDAFFYASAGEADVHVEGDLMADYEAAAVIPGRHFDVDLWLEGLQSESTWRSDGGLRYGLLYKYNFKIRWVGRFKRRDYVPGVPAADISWPCEASLTPFDLDLRDQPCTIFWGSGDLPCWQALGVDLPASCNEDLSWSPSLDWGWCDDDAARGPYGEINYAEALRDSNSFSLCFYPHPTAEVCLDGNLGICTALGIKGNSVLNEENGQEIVDDSGTMTVSPKVGCEFARKTDNERNFRFTEGPFDYDADIVLDVIGKIEPAIKLCLVELFEIQFNTGIALLCVPILREQYIHSLPFESMDATFSAPVVEPAVCDIEPSEGTIAGGSETEITWLTSWGAPDSCDCQAELSYRLRPQGTPLWGPWLLIGQGPNTGSYPWDVPPAYYNEAQIQVKFLDPNSDSLAVGVGGTFQIGLPCVQPDVGIGTAEMPPTDCSYESFGNPTILEDGLPNDASLTGYFEHHSFVVTDRYEGGLLGGEVQRYDAVVTINLFGTGPIEGYEATVDIPVMCEVHTAPWTPGEPVQQYMTEMYFMDGTAYNLPDFSMIRIRTGRFVGMPTRGENTITLLPTGEWSVESFFDLKYLIQYVGGPTFPYPGFNGQQIGEIPIVMGAPYVEFVPNDVVEPIHLELPPEHRLLGSASPSAPPLPIRFRLAHAAPVRLDIFDVAGHKVRVVLSEWQEPGHHRVFWDGRDDAGRRLESGVYFCQMRVDGEIVGSRKTILVK